MPSTPSTHHALVINAEQKGWEVKEQALPKFDDLLVRVHAVALNPTDWKHLGVNKPGYSSGSDFAGIVEKGTGEFKEGDKVAGFTRGGYLQRDNGAFAGTRTSIFFNFKKFKLRVGIYRLYSCATANCVAHP